MMIYVKDTGIGISKDD